MKSLSNELLVKAYEKAIECKLDKDFLVMLENEIIRRKQEINEMVSYEDNIFNFVIKSEDDFYK